MDAIRAWQRQEPGVRLEQAKDLPNPGAMQELISTLPSEVRDSLARIAAELHDFLGQIQRADTAYVLAIQNGDSVSVADQLWDEGAQAAASVQELLASMRCCLSRENALPNPAAPVLQQRTGVGGAADQAMPAPPALVQGASDSQVVARQDASAAVTCLGRKHPSKEVTLTHPCVDGKTARGQKSDCALCMPQNFCLLPSHISREGSAPRRWELRQVIKSAWYRNRHVV
jgi:hypothetical protein